MLVPQVLASVDIFYSILGENLIVKDMKEQLGFVLLDPSKPPDDSTIKRSYDLGDGGSVTLTKERYLCAEALFQPSLIGMVYALDYLFLYLSLYSYREFQYFRCKREPCLLPRSRQSRTIVLRYYGVIIETRHRH